VLPRESVKLLATFQPPIPGVQYFELNCRTLAGRLFRLEGRAEGLQPDVSLSHNVIKVSLSIDNGARIPKFRSDHARHMRKLPSMLYLLNSSPLGATAYTP
jgi:hypothetical protein